MDALYLVFGVRSIRVFSKISLDPYHESLPWFMIITSREQRLITKEHIATYTNLILWFNPLNTQVLVIKLFEVL